MSFLSIGGVPEHFNLPWQQAMLHDAFTGSGVDVAWTYYAGGTGALTEALQEGDLDLAILLTEGYVAARSAGLEARIVKVYIDTPLIWGIYTADPNVHSTGEPRRNYAISRYGSGSHLMAMIHAEQRGEELTPERFVVVKSLDGAMQALSRGEAQYFYWEKFMTRPFVDQGVVRLIGEFSAPWSGFLVVASEHALRRKTWSIRTILDIMNARCKQFPVDPQTAEILIRNFHMSPHEARQWLTETRWNTNYTLHLDHLLRARESLAGVGKCHPQLDPENCRAEWLEYI
ncbi:MAG: ABC transporter substrate-binding protein [Flavobacteriales bacterium]|jgi:sulfonate transport system substrate-binding protein